ncbi:MAG TPA: glutamate synthase subunit beta [Sedimentisphaerales bacterium]|jgi:NAD(P)H-dependent glutamate synthase small subunit|nr:glutamate synthase subunit beta [Sedimentisphaerales bacterium]HNU28619.1 glutamate synthase subunit beta [Sedimentisphaerales bacterium]
MGELKGFLKYERREVGHRSVEERVHDFNEIDLPLTPDAIRKQAARCMDCGIPFCHGAGCPVGNSIPDMNEFVYKGQWEQACRILHETNNFPEVTGRICPAPCETACTLAVSDHPVLIRHIEYQIVERGFQEGWIKPLPAPKKTGRRVAVVGSGPAGLAAAQQLARAGHSVVVFERDERVGGMLRYGIPDFKLGKHILDRRIEQLLAEGVEFQTGVDVGKDISAHYLRTMFDGICLAMGARQPRDIAVPGRELGNILFAMDYLTAQNKLCAAEALGDIPRITARDKTVIVLGGGDTGSDCVGTARRQRAREIYQLEILPKPPESRPEDTPWPMWPRMMRTSSSHEEGCERRWSVQTKAFGGHSNGSVKELHACKVEWTNNNGSWKLAELPGTEFTLQADLILLALGFVHVVHEGLVKDLGLQLDAKGNVIAADCQTSEPWVFAAGDTISGASLVVRAINSGREAAAAMDRWLRQGLPTR